MSENEVSTTSKSKLMYFKVKCIEMKRYIEDEDAGFYN